MAVESLGAPAGQRRYRILLRVAAAAWAAVIFAASSVTGSTIPGRFGYLAHFIEYAAFGALLSLAVRDPHDRTGSDLAALALASAYAVTDEIHQSFVPLRTVDPMDWLADTAGAAIAIIALVAVDAVARRLKRQ